MEILIFNVHNEYFDAKYIEILIFDIYNKDKFSILHSAEKRNLGIHQILDFEQCKLSFIQNNSLFLFG